MNNNDKTAQSILNKTGQKSTHHVAFGNAAGGEQKPKPEAPKSLVAPVQVTAPLPTAGFQIKDEVELLRSGFKNTHGEQVKSQGEKPGDSAGGGEGAGQPDRHGGAK